jgi:hypothetical protein
MGCVWFRLAWISLPARRWGVSGFDWLGFRCLDSVHANGGADAGVAYRGAPIEAPVEVCLLSSRASRNWVCLVSARWAANGVRLWRCVCFPHRLRVPMGCVWFPFQSANGVCLVSISECQWGVSGFHFWFPLISTASIGTYRWGVFFNGVCLLSSRESPGMSGFRESPGVSGFSEMGRQWGVPGFHWLRFSCLDSVQAAWAR